MPMREAVALDPNAGTPALGAEPRRGPVVGAVLLSLLMPGLGHVRLGAWQAGLLLVASAQLLIAGTRAVPHLMPPTPKALLLLVALGIGFVAVNLCVAMHAAWMARRQVFEVETVGRSAGTYVPLPLDVRVRQTGPELGVAEATTGSALPWFVAVCLIAVGIAAAVALPAKWGMITVHTTVMGPTLGVGDRVLVDLHRVGVTPRRGDVVLLQSHDEDQPFMLRRVIGLPFERVVIRRMSLMLNGNRLTPNETSEVVKVDGVSRQVWRMTLPFVEPFRILPDAASQMVDEPRLIVVSNEQLLVMRDDRASPVSAAGAVVGLAPTNEVQGVATTLLWKRGGGGFLRRL